jgi:phospholipid/cholesterol/gamma-HCH transport system substrate-binding protein
MQPSPTRDLIVGLFVLCGFAALAYLSIQVGGTAYSGRAGSTARHLRQVGGRRTGRDRWKVGQVSRIELDPELRARVTLDLDPTLQLPIDTSARIVTSGLLGDQFIALEPGAEEDMLKPGGEIDFTESAISLESLIGKFVNDAGLEEGGTE